MHWINYFSRNFVSVVKFRLFGVTMTNFKKIGWTSPEKPKFKIGWLRGKHHNSTLWDGQKDGLPEPFCLSLHHFSGLRRLPYLIWKKNSRAICWLKDLEYLPTDRYFMIIFLSWSCLNHTASTFWVATQSLLEVHQAIIPQMKEEIQGFHMNPNGWIVH